MVLTRLSIRQGDWGLGYNSIKFPDVFSFHKVLNPAATLEATRIYHVY